MIDYFLTTSDFMKRIVVVVSRLADGVVVYEGHPEADFREIVNAAAFMRIDLTIKFILDE